MNRPLSKGPRKCHDVNDVLSNYGFYRYADEHMRHRLAKEATFVSLPDGQAVMQAGGPCPQILFVGHGSVRVYVEAASTRQLNLYTVNSGECCPINIRAALTNAPADANGTTTGQVCAALMGASQFRLLAKESHEMTDWLLEETSARYAGIIALLNDVMTQSVDQRLARFLIDRAERDGEAAKTVVATHDEVARNVGTAREVISRRLGNLERAGVIAQGRGRIVLVNEDALLERV